MDTQKTDLEKLRDWLTSEIAADRAAREDSEEAADARWHQAEERGKAEREAWRAEMRTAQRRSELVALCAGVLANTRLCPKEDGAEWNAEVAIAHARAVLAKIDAGDPS
jgi:hypothetical protein